MDESQDIDDIDVVIATDDIDILPQIIYMHVYIYTYILLCDR